MAFNRPTLSELISRVRADFENRLQTIGTVLSNSVINVIANVIAGAAHLMHGHISYISKQIFADSAETSFLERQAAIWGLTRTAATFAGGTVSITGDEGAVIPAGTVLKRSDGVTYTTDSEVEIGSGGSVEANVTAETAGLNGNADAATTLSFESPISGVDSRVTVDGDGLSGGTDTETDAELKVRLLARIQTPPAGGNKADYETWALAVSGVTRAWVEPLLFGEGTVGIYFVKDNETPIFPTSGDVAQVSAYIGERKPVTAWHQVIAPSGFNIDVEIQSLDPFNSTVTGNIQEELQDLLFREGEPGGTIKISKIREAISIAAGEEDHTLISPTGNVEAPSGYLPVLGTLTFS